MEEYLCFLSVLCRADGGVHYLGGLGDPSGDTFSPPAVPWYGHQLTDYPTAAATVKHAQ